MLDMASALIIDGLAIAGTVALAGGVWQTFAETRAKVRAWKIAADEIAGHVGSDDEILAAVLERLSATDRKFVMKGLRQDSRIAERRYRHDILSTHGPRSAQITSDRATPAIS